MEQEKPMPHPDFARCARHVTADAVRELLSDMVNIPSSTGGESGMARYLVKRMSGAGLNTQLQEVDPGRPNAVGVREGRGRRREPPVHGPHGHLL